MNVVCLATVTGKLSVALGYEGGMVSAEVEGGRRQTDLLLPMVKRLLRSVDMKPEEIETALCLRGPGSFTGIRAGFSAVEGIAAAGGARAASIPALDCMAFPFREYLAAVVPAIDSRRGRYYSAVYRRGKRCTDYLDVEAADIAAALAGEPAALLTGPEAPLLRAELIKLLPGAALIVDPYFDAGQAPNMLRFFHFYTTIEEGGRGQGRAHEPADECGWDFALSVPLYIRKSDAEEKWQNR